MTTQDFSAVVEPRRTGGIAVKMPFDPATEWGERERYDITGTVQGYKVRGKLVARAGGYYLELGPAWCRDNPIEAEQTVSVCLRLEGPQVAAMDEDVAAAFAAEPEARRFFESLPTFIATTTCAGLARPDVLRRAPGAWPRWCSCSRQAGASAERPVRRREAGGGGAYERLGLAGCARQRLECAF